MEPVTVSAEELNEVETLLATIERATAASGASGALRLVGTDGESVTVPATVLHLLGQVAGVLARGDAVSVVSVTAELTTSKAADLLNVSRQYLVRLLDEERIPFRRVGSHRRVRAWDVLRFKAERDGERRAGLRDLTGLTEELGVYRDETGR